MIVDRIINNKNCPLSRQQYHMISKCISHMPFSIFVCWWIAFLKCFLLLEVAQHECLLHTSKIVGCACAGIAVNIPPPHTHTHTHTFHPPHPTPTPHLPPPPASTCAESLTLRGGETFSAFPAHAQPAVLCIWHEVHTRVILSESAKTLGEEIWCPTGRMQ